MKSSRSLLLFSLLFVALLLVSVSSIFMGAVQTLDPRILWEIRLPRVFLGALVGIALAIAGTLLQGLLRNPLADPYILGTSSGAALGALVSFQLRFLFPQSVAVSTFLFYLLIFAGAFLATTTSYLIARSERRVPPINLLLSGVIVSTFCGAVILLYFSIQPQDWFSLFFFLTGTLIEGNWNLILFSAAIILVGFCLAFLFARDLNIFSLGEEKALHLGIEVEKMKLAVFALASLIVSAAVAVSGTIGFVGLIVPHIARLIVGSDHQVLIPSAALMGGILLVITDAIARTVASPIEIPVGVITAMMGAPFFLWLLKRKRRERYF